MHNDHSNQSVLQERGKRLRAGRAGARSPQPRGSRAPMVASPFPGPRLPLLRTGLSALKFSHKDFISPNLDESIKCLT